MRAGIPLVSGTWQNQSEYLIKRKNPESSYIHIEEIEPPKIIKNNKELNPSYPVIEDISKDIKILTEISFDNYMQDNLTQWEDVLPIYPTSPIDK